MTSRNQIFRLGIQGLLALSVACLVIASLMDQPPWLIAPSLLFIIGAIVLVQLHDRSVREKFHWYESILDAVPLPLSVTDLEMRWTFVNKVVEGLLTQKRQDIMGDPCSNWGAKICGTSDCGVACLRRGKQKTAFRQWSRDFTVDTHYLNSLSGKPIGHVEVVQDITEKTQLMGLLKQLAIYSSTLIKSVNLLSDASKKISDSGDHVSAKTSDISVTTNEIAKNIVMLAGAAEEVSSNIQSVSAALDQVAQSIESISNNAQQGNDMAAQANQLTEQASGIMSKLGTSASETGAVTEIIKGIAGQTNLLALNATIEAARAGEAGKGFAVVAGEVKTLANQSSHSADTIVGRIDDIQDVSMRAETAIEEVNRVMETVSLAIQTINGEIIQQRAATNEVSGNLQQASQSSRDSAESINHVSSVIHDLHSSIQQINAYAKENSTAIHSVNNTIKDIENIARELDAAINKLNIAA